MRKLIALLILSIIGCGPYYAVSEVPRDVVLVSTPQEKPDDLPASEGCCGEDCQCCERCPCNEATAKVEMPQYPQSEIICYTMDGCAPCKAWNAPGAQADQLRATGWRVSVVDHGTGQQGWRYPSFRIKYRGNEHFHVGPMSHSTLRGIIGQ